MWKHGTGANPFSTWFIFGSFFQHLQHLAHFFSIYAILMQFFQLLMPFQHLPYFWFIFSVLGSFLVYPLSYLCNSYATPFSTSATYAIFSALIPLSHLCNFLLSLYLLMQFFTIFLLFIPLFTYTIFYYILLTEFFVIYAIFTTLCLVLLIPCVFYLPPFTLNIIIILI